jgi:hypothetical protein
LGLRGQLTPLLSHLVTSLQGEVRDPPSRQRQPGAQEPKTSRSATNSTSLAASASCLILTKRTVIAI